MAKVIISIFLFTGIVSYMLTCLFRNIALRLGVVNHPSGTRYKNIPIPLMGGVAIIISFWISMFLLFVLKRMHLISVDGYLAVFQFNRFIGIFIGTIILGIAGLIDDIKTLKPIIKICIQAVCALIVIKYGFAVSLIYTNSILSFLVTFFWILLIVNAFNLIDNMDGLSAGVALISAFIFLLISLLQGNWVVSAVIIIFMGSVAGFLPWNRYPAKIFMGDSGSSFLGYMLACITLITSYYQTGRNLSIAVLTPLLVFAIPIYDTLSVIVLRKKTGKKNICGRG